MPGLRLPAALTAEWRCDPEGLAELPRLAAECAAHWGLETRRYRHGAKRARTSFAT